MRTGPQPPRYSRVLGYIRVSGREQATDGTSLDGQRERIVRCCTERSYPAPDVRVEVESAGEEKLERRTELHRLIADARPGDLVIVALLDRWSRDIVFGVGSIRQLTRAGVGWYAISEQIDASTPQGDDQLGIMMWVVERERRRIRERTLGRRDALREQGLWSLGRVPFGYQRGPRETRQHLQLHPHPDQSPVVVDLHERVAGGISLRDVAAWLATVPGAPRHVAQIHRLIRARHYLGEMHVPGSKEWMRGKHPPLITLELWTAAQAGLAERRQTGRLPRGAVTADLLLRGIVRCALCGRRCGVTIGARGLRYYVCAKRRHARTEGGCAGPYLRTDRADGQATIYILARLGELREELEREPPAPRVGRLVDFAGQRQRVEAKLSRAVGLAVDGTITAGELAATRARLERELATVDERERGQAQAAQARSPEARATVKDALRHLARAWTGATVEERREAVQLLAAGVSVTREGELAWAWRPVEELVRGGVAMR